MPTASDILLGFVLPALIVAGGLLMAWWKGEAHWIGGTLVAGAFAISFAVLHAPVAAPSTNAVQWIFWFTIPVAVFTLFEGIFRPPTWLGAMVILLLWRLGVRALLTRLVPDTLATDALEAWIDITCAVVLALWLTFMALPRMAAPLVLAMLCFGVGIAIATVLHSIQLSFLAFAFFGLCIAAAVAARISPRIVMSHGAISAVILLLNSLLVFAWFYGSDTPTRAQQVRTGFLLASPLLAFVADIPVLARLRPAWRLGIRLLLVGLVIAIVSGMNITEFVHADQVSQSAGE